MAYTMIDAVNHVLLAANEPPVTSLTNETTSAATLVKSLLDKERLHVLSEGLQFNTRRAMFAPDVNGHIAMGSNILSVDGYGDNEVYKYTVVDKKLYDTVNQTDVFTKEVNLEVIYEFPFKDMPIWVQYRIMTTVALNFHSQFSPDPAHMQTLTRIMSEALSRCNEKELLSHDIDMVVKTPLGQVAKGGLFRRWRL